MAYLGYIFPRLPTPFAHSNGVVIRTNTFATVIDIKAPQDTVHHYGFAADVLVEKNNSASYHEYGTVGRLEVQVGHFVAEPTAVVFCMMDTREDKSNEAEAPTIKEGAKVYVGDTEKVQGGATIAENGVADKYVNKCLDGQHTYHKLVIDPQHIYDVCETCGYTVVAGAAQETSGKSTATAVGDVPDGMDIEKAQKCEHSFVLSEIDNYEHKAQCSKCGVSYNEAHTKTMGTYCACGHYNPELSRIWWWGSGNNPYPKKVLDSNAYYPDYTVPKVKLQVGQMLPIKLYYQTKEQLGTTTITGWVAITSSNPAVVKVTSNILVPIEECQYMKWYSYLYCVGEGTCTLTFEDETQSGLVKYDVEVTVTRETTIDKIDIGSYYTFGQFEFKDKNSASLGNHDIEWIVLDKDIENNRIYVVSKDILCDMKFDATANQTATFDNSSIKTWLNGDFKNGFGENASKIFGDIGLLDYSALPYYDESKWDYVSGTLFGDWNAAKAQHYGVEVQREGIGSGAVSSANSPSFWIIGEGGKACLGGQGQSYHNNEHMNNIKKGTTAGVRPAMWITLGE